MEKHFRDLIEQVPQDIYSDMKAHICEGVAIFKPKGFIVNKKMCSEDYTFILPSSALPPARIGNLEIQMKKDSLITIGSGVEFFCNTHLPTREYTNIVIKKKFFEGIAFRITGKRNIDLSKVEYARSKQLLRIISDLESELIFNGGECSLMVQSITTQLVIQLLRDTGNYARNCRNEPYKACNSEVAAQYTSINPAYYSILSNYNKLLPKMLRLTPREKEVSIYLIERFEYDEIANRLFISPNTLKTHVRNIYKKLDVSGRKELVEKLNRFYIQI